MFLRQMILFQWEYDRSIRIRVILSSARETKFVRLGNRTWLSKQRCYLPFASVKVVLGMIKFGIRNGVFYTIRKRCLRGRIDNERLVVARRKGRRTKSHRCHLGLHASVISETSTSLPNVDGKRSDLLRTIEKLHKSMHVSIL